MTQQKTRDVRMLRLIVVAPEASTFWEGGIDILGGKIHPMAASIDCRVMCNQTSKKYESKVAAYTTMSINGPQTNKNWQSPATALG